MNTVKILAATALMVAPISAMAQKGVEDGSKYGHGEDSVTCIMNLVQYGDAVKQKNYAEALEPWKIVFSQCPLAKGTGLYTDGIKIMKDLYVKDAANKETYYNFLMKIYDQRAKYYGTNKKYPTSYLMGMKALDIVQYKGNDDQAVRTEALGLLETALAGDASTIQPAFVQTYLSLKVKDFKASSASAEDVVNAYVKCGDILTKVDAVANEKTKEAVSSTKDNVEQIFASSGAADCETLEKIFGPQLSANKSDQAWLTRVNKLLSNGECTDNDLYYSTSQCLHELSPAASSARGLAKMYLKQNDVTKALSYYDEAIKLEDDTQLKAKYYYESALVNFSATKFSAAREACYNAISLRGDWGDPYILLAKVYATGARNIGEKDYEKKAGYWAAVDKLQRAKAVDSSETVKKEANELISQYSQYFPSKEDLFFEGIQDGTAYKVGGFINESTTVRAKK